MNIKNTMTRLSTLLENSQGVIAFDDIATHTDKRKGGPAALEVETGFLLYSFIKRYKLKHIVETGTHFGYSGAWLASALADNYETDPHEGRGTLWTVDVDAYGGKASFLWRQMALSPFIKSFRMESVEFNLSLLPQIDMLFLDSVHSMDYVIKEFEHFKSKLADFSLIVFHDTTLVPELQDAVKEIKRLLISPMAKTRWNKDSPTPLDDIEKHADNYRKINHIEFRNMRGLDILVIEKDTHGRN